MITKNLPILRIHDLTQEQYDRKLAAGEIEDGAIYLTEEPAVTAISMEQVDNTIAITYTMDDDSTSIDIITLDANGYPANINVDGIDIPIVMNGFAEEEVVVDG